MVRLFVFPSLMIHYIEAHEYRPPDDFLEAARRCTSTRGDAYKEQIRRLMPELWAKHG